VEDSKRLTFSVPAEFDGAMLKAFLRRGCGLSSRLMVLLKQTENGILRNGRHARVIEPVTAGDMVTLRLPEENCAVEPFALPLAVVYEDAHLLVLNKPSGMPVHPTSCGHEMDTLANAVSFYMRSRGESYAFRPLNRLDKNTTGLVLTAKEPYSAYRLKTGVEKRYTAVCEGVFSGSGTVDAPIRVKEGHTIEREAGNGGQRAVTHYKTLAGLHNHTLAQFTLETGRTHQIRVHMAYLGHPLAGDDMYGGSTKYIARQALHCERMSFLHPVTSKKMELFASLPDDMARFIEQISTKTIQNG